MRIRVLVVDDEELIQRLCRRVLSQLGCEVVCAGSSEMALNLVSDCFDWVLTDIQMPGKDGIWLAGQLKALYPHLKIVLMTGNITEEKILRAKGLALSLLLKPFEIEGLMGIFRRQSAPACVA